MFPIRYMEPIEDNLSHTLPVVNARCVFGEAISNLACVFRILNTMCEVVCSSVESSSPRPGQIDIALIRVQRRHADLVKPDSNIRDPQNKRPVYNSRSKKHIDSPALLTPQTPTVQVLHHPN